MQGMQRYFVAPEQFGDGDITITGDDAHHATRVMRMKSGDRLIVSDGAGRTAIAAVSRLSPQAVEAEVLEYLPSSSEPVWSVTIAQGLPKGDKMETVVQKGTEIGADGFIPFQSERMIVQYDAGKEGKRLERWRKIAKEAAEQSHRDRLPVLSGVLSWKMLLQQFDAFNLVLFCYEARAGEATEHGEHGIAGVVRQWRASGRTKTEPASDAPTVAMDSGAAGSGASRPRILLVVGPEGGFTEREAFQAEAAGAVAVGLGRRILRAETAGFVGLTCLLYEAGEMGGA